MNPFEINKLDFNLDSQLLLLLLLIIFDDQHEYQWVGTNGVPWNKRCYKVRTNY